MIRGALAIVLVGCRGGAMVAVRADGCSGTEPEGRCATEGQRCRYGTCCVTEYTCKDGPWGITMQACPP